MSGGGGGGYERINETHLSVSNRARETVSLTWLAMLSTHSFRLEQETVRHSRFTI